MGNTPNIDSSAIAKFAINQAKINSSEYRNNPNWVNDYTRLNAENVNKMRENIYKYVEEVTTQSLVQENEVVKDLVEDTVGKKYPKENSTGEIFNDYENNQASGDYSHVGGTNSEASGKASFTHGINLKATAQAQAVFGQFNEQNDNALFIVGNGTDSNHKNAFEVLATGAATLQTQGTTDNSLVINKTLNNKVSEINNNIDTKVEAINEDIESIRTSISNALHFRGVIDFDPLQYTGADYKAGDVVIWAAQGEEYVYDGSKFVELGNANDFLLKTSMSTSITQTGSNDDVPTTHAVVTYVDEQLNGLNDYYIKKPETVSGSSVQIPGITPANTTSYYNLEYQQAEANAIPLRDSNSELYGRTNWTNTRDLSNRELITTDMCKALIQEAINNLGEWIGGSY